MNHFYFVFKKIHHNSYTPKFQVWELLVWFKGALGSLTLAQLLDLILLPSVCPLLHADYINIVHLKDVQNCTFIQLRIQYEKGNTNAAKFKL